MKNSIISSKIATFEPSGYITAANVNEFKSELLAAVNSQDYTTFLVDMSRVEFVDSAGLMAIVSAFRQAQSLGRQLSLCSLAPSVRIIFELTQLDRIVEIFEDCSAFIRATEQLVAI
ncbi:STAS domain-containing protein [Candidatus Gracilibacteria bacterium]|jgi:anti-sigma B factor antagonist|nr:STAS domain-containing protein [Candidatus Gracilibacteria bacterium]NJM90495.1 STAS domain-containing protein [Hydrococcus sp. RU_2_2]NJP21458.1 STAS domain-containing protein [Hydrococcus sp. CRU_1_1]